VFQRLFGGGYRGVYWNFTLCISIFVTIGSFLAGVAMKSPATHKGTWIWDTPTLLTQREEILEFSKQNGVTHIYLYVDRTKTAPKDYKLFIKEASTHQIKVEALAGDPAWGWKHQRKHIEDFIAWVASYNTNVNEDERFSGIHLDIEPYLLPEWETNRDLVVEEWLSNLEFAANQADGLGEMKVTLDVPFWIHKIEVPGYRDYDVSDWMLKRFDTIVLMDYRDTAEGIDGIVSNALSIVDKASAARKSVIVGVEIAPNNDADKTTFYQEGSKVMEQELEITRRHLDNYDGFRGVAVHGFPEWMSAESKGE
jgi:hypothetical protein